MKIKSPSLLLVFILAACTQTNTSSQLFWDYSPFEKAPRVSLEQAHSICNGYANNAAGSAGQSPQYSGAGDFGTLFTAAYVNKANMQAAYNNFYKSCMAQNGWNAYLTSVRNAPSESANSKIAITKGTDAALQACISTHGNAVVNCKVKSKIIKKGCFAWSMVAKP
jgi:hypothetical protein